MKGVAVLLFLFVLLLSGIPAQAAGRVERVSAEVTAQSSLPPLVRDRMTQSVSVIAGQLLEGQSLDELEDSRTGKEQLIREVFDKVLVGYTVRDVRIFPGETTEVEVHLLPWAEVIRQVEVDVTVEGMPPRIESMVRRDLSGVDTVFRDALTGLPTAASDWTNGVLKHSLNAYLAEHLPEFRADFEMDPEPLTKVRLVVYPKLPVVRTVDLSMRSDTVPNFTLLTHRDFMQGKADELVGVPVAFVRRHEAELSRQFAGELDALPDFSSYHMKTQVDMDSAERLHLMSRSDTSRYRLRLTGWLDIGRDTGNGHNEEDNLLFRLHAGSMLSRQDELFLLFDLMPQQMDWAWSAGYDRLLNAGTHGQIRYDMRRHRFVLAASRQLAPRWLLRYEYRLADHVGEVGLRYKMHDFLSMEYILDRDQNWLRLIGNF